MSINVTGYIEDLQNLQELSLKELGISFFIAFFIGFIIKKGLKLFLFLLFIVFSFLFLFASKEFLTVDSAILLSHSDTIVLIAKRVYVMIKEAFTWLSFTNGTAFGIGLLLGFKLG